MRGKKTIRLGVMSVALVSLLVFATTLGNVVHHHSGLTGTNCCICHLTHQIAEGPQAPDHASKLATIGQHTEPQEPSFLPDAVPPRFPARAPPVA